MLLLFLAVNFAAAGLGSHIGERGHGTEVWYASLRKPQGMPADASFTPIWSLVILSTAVSGWLIWLNSRSSAFGLSALVLYGFQLIINAAWQGTTMGFRRLGQGFALAVLLWVTISLTIWAAYPDAGAGYWLMPYWVWVGLGVHWNWQLWRLNRPVPEATAEAPGPPTQA